METPLVAVFPVSAGLVREVLQCSTLLCNNGFTSLTNAGLPIKVDCSMNIKPHGPFKIQQQLCPPTAHAEPSVALLLACRARLLFLFVTWPS